MAAPPQLDHGFVNTRLDLDRAGDAFAGMGFTLTARGHHSLGSINQRNRMHGGALGLHCRAETPAPLPLPGSR